jgi:hypothetical protein
MNHDSRRHLDYAEFYITNVCNLTCTNCNRYNNFEFKGWQDWKDYEAEYEEWAKHIHIQRLVIMGGEPLLNPTILEWIRGLNRIFKKNVQVLTNGTRLNHVPGLYEAINTSNDPEIDFNSNWIGVSLHNENDRERCFEEIRKFLKGKIRYYHKDDPQNVNNRFTYGATHAFYDENNVMVCVWEYDSFYNAAIQKNSAGRYVVHDNDPEQAHSVCGFVQYKCYHFIKAKLFKCGPVGLFPEFDKQFNLDISEQDRQLMNSYRPLSAFEFQDRGHEFLNHIDDVIPQCKFCPVTFENTKIYAINKRSNATSSFE